jgi:hypothetical protein
LASEARQGDEWGTYIGLGRVMTTYRGIAYSPRGPWRRSCRSSRRSNDRPGSAGKLRTGRRVTGVWMTDSGRAANGRITHNVKAITRKGSDTGERTALKGARCVREGAEGKGPQGTSSAAYFTLKGGGHWRRCPPTQSHCRRRGTRHLHSAARRILATHPYRLPDAGQPVASRTTTVAPNAGHHPFPSGTRTFPMQGGNGSLVTDRVAPRGGRGHMSGATPS